MSQLLIHPGFHKTGTTFLQQCVFSDQRFFRTLLSHVEANELFVRPHEANFDVDCVRNELGTIIAAQETKSVKVISSEILSGNILTGSKDSHSIARRLFKTIPEAKILFTVRNQEGFILSAFLQYVKRGGRKKLADFLRYRPEPGYDWFDLRSLQFERLVSLYAEHYGKENILVLPQELMRRDMSKFLSLLFAFANVDEDLDLATLKFPEAVGKSPPASGVPILRFANLFRPTALNPEGPKSLTFIAKALVSVAYRYKVGDNSAKASMKREIEESCGDIYGSSNLSLQKFCPVDLGELGYQMKQASF